MTTLDWVTGDKFGLAIPAHAAALRAVGESFLTRAFHMAGTLPPSNRVVGITRFEECLGGGTGRKIILSVDFAKPAPQLASDLFVKFSRDFADHIRDRSRHMMESEVRLAVLSRSPEFPIAVPRCAFADFHRESGTGILITERVAFGNGSIEPQYPKCLDYDMPEPLAHYMALVSTLAKLSGTHKAGRLADAEREFPFDVESAVANDPIPYNAQRLRNRVARFADFAAAHPQLLPPNIRSAEFLSRLTDDVVRFSEHELAIKRYLNSKPEFVALCHWNANVDNAWFWRNAEGELACGLLDWGRVGQMNVAASLYGALSGAETEIWNDHLDALLARFAAVFAESGGPALDVAELKLHLHLFTALMGLAYLLDAPPIIKMQLPDLALAESRFDARFRRDETARVQLHMITMFLDQWQRQDFGAILDEALQTKIDVKR